MDDFPGLLARDFGYKPQGKSAPMSTAASRNNSNSTTSSANFGLGSNSTSDFTKSSSLKSNTIFDDHDRDGLLFNDVFGGPPKYSTTSSSDSRGGGGAQSSAAFDYDSIFKDQNAKSQTPKSNSMPVFDKPVYDDDIFEGLPGLKSSTSSSSAAAPPSAKFDNVFASISGSPKHRSARESSAFDDLLGNFGKKETIAKVKTEKDAPVFDDLIPGFGRSTTPSSSRSTSESTRSQKPPSSSTKTASSVMEDPFVVLESTSTPVGSSSGVLPDPLEEIGKFNGSGSSKLNGSSVSGGVFDDLDPLDSLGKSVPPVSSEVNKRGKDRSPLRTGSTGSTQTHPSKESSNFPPMENSEENRSPVDNFQEFHDPLFDMPSVSTDSHRFAGRATSPPPYMSASSNETNSRGNTTPRSEEIFESSDDIWLTVSEIPLFTQPTTAAPPSRPPPTRPTRVSKPETSSFSTNNARKKVNEFSSVSNSTQYPHSPKSARAPARSSMPSQMDELEDFAMGRTQNSVNDYAEVLPGEDAENSTAAASAAAMKEAMDRAEAKFRHAKEMRERESLKAARNKESVQLDKDERGMQDAQDRERHERLDPEMQQREREEEEREQRRLEREREREREEKERDQRRLEKEKIERERERARQAVERATREARERAAAEARQRAERAAVDKATSAARERAERAAVMRAQAEARERAAADARERAEKAAAEARERATAEAREKEARERASVARAEAEVKHRAERAAVERAAAEARERAAAASRANQNSQKNDNDLESFFSMGSRPSSAPRPRGNSSDPLFDTQSKGGPETARRTSVGTSSNMKKASSTTNIVDDLSSIFGAASSSSGGDFQDIEGETEERRRARLERHQRTQERAAKALAEKNQRDLQVQRDQAERHRIAETLDAEIKRWAAGKEGNLRSLLATLQYVLWPECGWQPISLTDLITGASVKKAYRKATLCIHPDKVQQKGANLQQKYVAEKVFDLLKEAWNKFNSEELF